MHGHSSQNPFIQANIYKVTHVVYLTSTLRAPSGVTRVAGANAYAAKLAASPAPTVKFETERKRDGLCNLWVNSDIPSELWCNN